MPTSHITENIGTARYRAAPHSEQSHLVNHRDLLSLTYTNTHTYFVSSLLYLTCQFSTYPIRPRIRQWLRRDSECTAQSLLSQGRRRPARGKGSGLVSRHQTTRYSHYHNENLQQIQAGRRSSRVDPMGFSHLRNCAASGRVPTTRIAV